MQAVATANIASLSGAVVVDDVSLTAGDRVLLTGQDDADDNGIWTVAAGAWSRAADMDAPQDFLLGQSIYVEGGTSNGETYFALTDAALPVNPGNTPLEYSGTSGSSLFTAFAAATWDDVANTLVRRDADKRFQAADPSDPQDVATKSYVDGSVDAFGVGQGTNVAVGSTDTTMVSLAAADHTSPTGDQLVGVPTGSTASISASATVNWTQASSASLSPITCRLMRTANGGDGTGTLATDGDAGAIGFTMVPVGGTNDPAGTQTVTASFSALPAGTYNVGVMCTQATGVALGRSSLNVVVTP